MNYFKQFLNKKNINNFEQIYFLFASLLITVLTLILLGLNLRYPFLWFDESITFWIAKGIHPESLPFTLEGDFTSCLYYNKYFNLDPGGFTILLHFWSKISNNHFFIRTLPFIFYVIYNIFFIKVIYIKINDYFLSTVLMIMINIFFGYFSTSFELRGYSMELLTIILSLSLIIKSDKKMIPLKKIFFHSIILALLMTSRYSSMILVFTTISIVYLSQLSSSKLVLQNVKLFVSLYLPFLVVSILIIFWSYQTQKTFSNKLPYLKYLNSNPEIIFEFKNLIFIILLIYLIFLYIYSNKSNKNLILFTLLINLIFIFLSILGKYPWEPLNSRSNVISLTTILTFILTFNNIFFSLLLKKNIKFILSILVLIIFNFNAKKLLIRFDKKVEIYSDLLSMKDLKNKKILVDRWSNLSVRYLYEYGNLRYLKKKHKYPINFTLLSSRKKYLNTITKTNQWYNNQIKTIDVENYSLLIIPELYKYKKINLNNWISIDDENQILIRKKI